MARSRDERSVISDRWRVVSLIRAILDLILALCVLVCAIISIATTRIIRASGLFPPCTLCEGNGQRRPRGDAEDYDSLEFCSQERNLLPSNSSRVTYREKIAMNSICENCTLALSECTCALKRAPLLDNISSPRTHSKRSTAINTVDDGYGKIPLHNDERSCQKRGSRAAKTLDSGCDDVRDRIKIQDATVSHGCRCRRSSSRDLKRKFAKVFPHDSDHALVCSESACLHMEGHADAVDSAVRRQRDGSATRFREGSGNAADEIPEKKDVLSDIGDSNSWGEFTSEESLGDSSRESFSYNRRSALMVLGSSDVCRSRRMRNLSIDTDLLVEQTTSEWNGSSASLSNDADEKWSRVLYDDPDIGEIELREAFQAEHEALVALHIELEEERNASSSAAHEAMAMITRLQEEKASVQMAARQYQRMAEEKQMYDQEAMAELEEILGRRDEDIYALEGEVDFYRAKLISLTMGELMEGDDKDRLGSPRSVNDILLIERETLSLQGSEAWKNILDNRDEKILAEIKDWLHAANERAVSKEAEALDDPRSSQIYPGKVSGLSLIDGRKKLLDSFSSVAVESGHSDGVVIDDAEAQRETAAGFAVFQGMMETLRQEPRLRDEESLETLKKIEEKFQIQSSRGTPRNGDELRQIWKNTLKSFESNESGNVVIRSGFPSAAQKPTLALAAADSSDHPHQDVDVDEVGDVDANKTSEEKRLSVLEYVSKFEEQLHQLDNDKPFQFGKSNVSPVQPLDKSRLSNAESPLELSAGANGASTKPTVKRLDSFKIRKFSPAGERRNVSKTRVRRLSGDATNSTLNTESSRFSMRGEAAPFGRYVTDTEERTSGEPSGYDEYGNDEEPSLKVHQRDPAPGVTLPGRRETHVIHDINKSVSSTENDLVRGEFIDSHETARCIEGFRAENCEHIGKPELILDNTFVDLQPRSEGRQNDICPGDFADSTDEQGICEQDVRPRDRDLNQGDLEPFMAGRAPYSPTSLCTDFTGSKTDDVVQHLKLKLKSLETDRQMMELTISALRRENGQMNLLQEIAQHLRELRGKERTAVSTESWPSEDPTVLSSMKSGEITDGPVASFCSTENNNPRVNYLPTLLEPKPVGFQEKAGIGDETSVEQGEENVLKIRTPACCSGVSEAKVAVSDFHYPARTQLSKLTHLFLGNGESGDYLGDQDAVLRPLLYKSPHPVHWKPLERARSFKAKDAAVNYPLGCSSQLSLSTFNNLSSQQSWPMSTRETCETALSGWDY